MPRWAKISSRPEQPLVVFDGDCGFCKFWVEWCRIWTGSQLRFEPFQTEAERLPEIERKRFEEAVQFIEQDGSVYGGADAVFRVLTYTSFLRWLAAILERDEPFMRLARWGYGFVAGHRMYFSLLTKMAWGHDPRPSRFTVARRFFSHGLGVIFFVAFASWAVQWRGLVSSQGIVPAASLMENVSRQIGTRSYQLLPSLFWFGNSDAALQGGCIAGLVLSLALACGIWPGGCALLCWTLYLSFCSVSSPFLDFQWDTLLLETGLIAAVYLPWSFLPKWNQRTSGAILGRWLVCWLNFRLMFESGVVKLSSGDSTWYDLTALHYHYETQPLPLWTAWYADQSPMWVLKLETLIVFTIELIVPFFIFAPRRLRHAAGVTLIALQVGILATGNYAFFNWLSILLCIPLFADSIWPQKWRLRLLKTNEFPPWHGRRWVGWTLASLAAVVLLVTGDQVISSFGWRLHLLDILEEPLAPLRSFNSYGLFRVMTQERPEIIIEGSEDGKIWRAYDFRWKPGDVYTRPQLVAPHQPRLDWQMWFAALGTYRENPWFINCLARLLEGSPDVLALLESNPFPDAPPKYIRAMLYQYHFTHYGDAAWWRRELQGPYCPTLSKRPKDSP